MVQYRSNLSQKNNHRSFPSNVIPHHVTSCHVMPCYFLRLMENPLTHWGRVTHISVSNVTIIGSDSGLSPGRWQAIISTSAGILLIWPLGKTVNSNRKYNIFIHDSAYENVVCEMAAMLSWPQCVKCFLLSWGDFSGWDLRPTTLENNLNSEYIHPIPGSNSTESSNSEINKRIQVN